MFRTILLTAIVLLIAVGGGAASVWWALGAVDGLGALQIGAWTAYPQTGTTRADPYSRARAAREAELPLGPSEGLVFIAHRDSQGQPLLRSCAYLIQGASPAARFFTLHAADAGGATIRRAGGRAPGLHSTALVRAADSSLTVSVDTAPQPGNWLAIDGDGPMTLILTLYDTPVASSARVGEVVLPTVARTGCR